MNRTEYFSRKKRLFRRIKYWIMKKLCSPEEWQLLRHIRSGYFGIKPEEDEGPKPVEVSFSFDLDREAHVELHSAQGIEKYDARHGAIRELLREKESEIMGLAHYQETYNVDKGCWVCAASIKILPN